MKLSKHQTLFALYFILTAIVALTGVTVYGHIQEGSPSGEAFYRLLAPACLLALGLMLRIAQLHWQIRKTE